MTDGQGISSQIAQVIVTGPYWWKVKTDSGNALVPSGNKPLPEPMLTQIYVAIWHHQATMSPNCQSGKKNLLQWNINQNTKLFIHKNAFENVPI